MIRPILYRARYLLPIATPPIEDGALLIADDRVRAIGPAATLQSASPDAVQVDLGDAVLLPPLVNAHTHLELTDYADWVGEDAGSPASFVDWILQLVATRRGVTDEQVCASLARGLDSALASGTGAIGDILTTLSAATAYRTSPLAGRVFAEVLGHDPGLVRDRLTALEPLIGAACGPGLQWGLSPHATYTLTGETLHAVQGLARRHALPLCMHLAESREETTLFEAGRGPLAERLYTAAGWRPDPSVTGRTPTAWLIEQNLLRSGDLVVHGVQVTDHDVTLLKRSGAAVVLCPRSNARLGVGRAPVEAYLAAGVPLALGTDSLASAPSLSLWEELAFACNGFADAASPARWLEIATRGGARALGLAAGEGELVEGGPASFQAVQLPTLPNLDALEETLCKAGSELVVSQMWLHGRNVLPPR